MKWRRGWLLPLVCLAGYLFAWGSILLDRQMIIEEQKALSRELGRVRQELKLQEMVDDFGDDWQEMVIWNEKAIAPPQEVGK